MKNSFIAGRHSNSRAFAASQRYQRTMRVYLLTFILILLRPTMAQACVPVTYGSDRERLAEAISALKTADVALDGVVTKGSRDVGSVAIIRPRKIWFGSKQSEYHVRKVTMCDDDFTSGEHVRILLHRLPEQTSFFSKAWAWLWGPSTEYTSGFFSSLEFAWAMRSKEMRQAVSKKSRH
ncbi:hypothetical protein [Sphingobium herbicidovorans]